MNTTHLQRVFALPATIGFAVAGLLRRIVIVRRADQRLFLTALLIVAISDICNGEEREPAENVVDQFPGFVHDLIRFFSGLSTFTTLIAAVATAVICGAWFFMSSKGRTGCRTGAVGECPHDSSSRNSEVT